VHSVFIARTPLQLLSAYVVASQVNKHTINDLILINPRGNALWHSSFCIKRMATDQNVWQRVFTFAHRVARRSELFKLSERLQALRTDLLALGPIDCVYLGADREFDNQLLVELTGNTTYIRLEDGVWSYASPDRSISEKIEMWFWSRLVRYLAGVKTNMRYNYRGGGYGQAATADYLFKPNLLQRPSPHALEIPKQAVHAALEQVTQGMEKIPELADAKSILFLGSVFVDQGKLKAEQELKILKSLYSEGQEKGMQLFYKPHPFEKKDKLAFYQSEFPKMTIITVADPIELIYYCYPNIKAVATYSSSGLLYTDIFAKQQLLALGLFKLFPIEQDEDILTKLMLEAGVKIPQNMAELTAFIRGLA